METALMSRTTPLNVFMDMPLLRMMDFRRALSTVLRRAKEEAK